MRSFDESELDRKSSRGMIYENEELRLRTININAEVERGQSDIKRLRRENEQLRREIWTLRDECDRLNKRFKAKLADHDHGGTRGSGGSGSTCPGRGSGGVCDSYSSDSDSCETCRANDDQCSDECCGDADCAQCDEKLAHPQSLQQQQQQQQQPQQMQSPSNVYVTEPSGEVQQLHPTFDHLSVVSEETLSNPELLASESLLGFTPDISGSQNTLPSLVGPLTPLTPIELVANQLNDLQATVPPLSYFENVLQRYMDGNAGTSTGGTTPEAASTTTPTKTVKHTNGWDYNLESPFTARKFSQRGKPPSVTISPAAPQRHPAPTLTTFVPTNVAQPVTVTDVSALKAQLQGGHSDGTPSHSQQTGGPNVPTIETVAITTMPTSTPPALNSPKHFFAPLKPKLRINTALANKVATPELQSASQGGPPDLYVANGLATPYQRVIVQPGTPSPPPPPSPPSPPLLPPRSSGTTSSPQTDSLNLDKILNDIETISGDILAMQLDRGGAQPDAADFRGDDKTKKPYRSEMNLQLSYDGPRPTITPTPVSATTQPPSTVSQERDSTDSPPEVPAAMAPFPANRTYGGLEPLPNAATSTPPTTLSSSSPTCTAASTTTATSVSGSPSTATGNATPSSQRPLLPTSPLATVTRVGSKPNLAAKPPPPAPPARVLPPPLNIRSANASRPPLPTTPSNGGLLAPNKSHLYSSLANAAAKRAQFRSASRSLDPDLLSNGGALFDSPRAEVEDSELAGAAEAARRKARRVSIVCGDSSVANTPDGGSTLTPAGTPLTAPMSAQTASLGSCMDLPSSLVNPALRSIKQTSHSTPSSPHSARRLTAAATASSTPLHNLQQPQQQYQQQQLQLQQPQHRKMSQDSTRGRPADLAAAAAAAALVSRSKCSRRHSEATLASNHRVSGASGGHHHHHHHGGHQHQHQHQHFAHSAHHHHSRPNSNSNGNSSGSEHHSSFGSSRESSTSFSMRSQRRKISVSSHTNGGKIPWCGCWGNGCL